MKPIPIILLCLMLSACATQQIKPTLLPEVIINYEAQVTDEEKASLKNTIMDAVSCDLPVTIVTITIMEYYKPDALKQFVGWPYQGFLIRAYIETTLNQKPFSFYANGKSRNVSVPLTTLIIGIPGLVTSTVNNSTRDIHDAELSLAKSIWKQICRIQL